ncbi:MAG: DNA gyrase inhibitor YacG [Planctomycetes bacterium]|nr:DNA gyrase inhibitor YacG [Planctomycetota bacterium]
MARARKRKCPTCKAAFVCAGLADNPWFPFCSERCKLVDLGAWLSDQYAVTEDLTRENDIAAPESDEAQD